jgi:UDP-hydrolysing UDP-N-acetyl-D-glucosamine 2-epimerase
VVLGDRIELLAAASAAVALRVPIAHIHGGESSEGVLDEQVRHAVSKLAHLHFPAATEYRRRLLAMGEEPNRVFAVGAPGLEYIRRAQWLGRAELEKRIGLDLSAPFVLATLHPANLSLNGTKDGTLDALLKALDRTKTRVIFTFANADAGGRSINARIKNWAAARKGRAAAVASLGQQGYLSLMRLASTVVGNSSSGIIETPSLRVPTVNIGERQAGRLRAPSVIDCAPTALAVRRSLSKALSPSFRKKNCRGTNPYGGGSSAAAIIKILKRVPLGEPLLRKKFIDQ